MVTVTNKYVYLADAISRFKAVNEPYEVWLDYQKQGYVFVKTGYLYRADSPTVYCIITGKISIFEWCVIANSLTSQGYNPVLLNSKDLYSEYNA